MMISTVMVCRNAEATIQGAIASWQAQTHSDRELLVIDGASTDATCARVEALGDARIKLWSAPDTGVYDALNKGIARAKGEVIGILHSNDRFARDDILSAVAEQFGDPTLEAAYADVIFVDFDRPDHVLRRYNSGSFSPARLAWGIMPAHTALHLRARVFEAHGLYHDDYRIAGDFEFIARIFKDGKLSAAYVKDDWIMMSQGGLSTAGLGAKLTINREVLRACRENGIRTNHLKLMTKYPAKLLEVLRP